jgi:hypothetical protein
MCNIFSVFYSIIRDTPLAGFTSASGRRATGCTVLFTRRPRTRYKTALERAKALDCSYAARATYRAGDSAQYFTLPNVRSPEDIEFDRLCELHNPTKEQQKRRDFLWAKFTANAIPVSGW